MCFFLVVSFNNYFFCYAQAGANPNINAGGATPLHVAADVGNLEVIRSLLNAGADPNASDDVQFFLPPQYYKLWNLIIEIKDMRVCMVHSVQDPY